jgi:hypothetical protein
LAPVCSMGPRGDSCLRSSLPEQSRLLPGELSHRAIALDHDACETAHCTGLGGWPDIFRFRLLVCVRDAPLKVHLINHGFVQSGNGIVLNWKQAVPLG